MKQIRLGDIEPHFWLTRSVARCMGLSLSEAMAEGRLSEQGYAELVTQCRAAGGAPGGCRAACEQWLAAQQSEDRCAPEFCPNAERLNGLRRSKA